MRIRAPPAAKIQAMTTLSNDVLSSAVRGQNLDGAVLSEVLGERPTALVFLRHFG